MAKERKPFDKKPLVTLGELAKGNIADSPQYKEAVRTTTA